MNLPPSEMARDDLADGLSAINDGLLPAAGGDDGKENRHDAVSRTLAKSAPLKDQPELLQGYYTAHRVEGRLRLRPFDRQAALRDFARISATLTAWLAELFPGAVVSVSQRTGSVLVIHGENAADPALAPLETKTSHALPAAPRNPFFGKVLSFFFPRVIVSVIAVIRALPYIFAGLRSLLRGSLGMDVLDGAALLVCLLRRDFKSVSSITFFFALGEFLADRTRKKSRASLEESLALKIDVAWIREGGLERQIPFAELKTGDEVIVRAGYALPVDGMVIDGQGMVNQSSMTGESQAAHKKAGASVYAGTVLEEGELCVRASRVGSGTRINAILRTIEESENVKARIQGRYEHVADAIVPYNFLLSGLVYALTRDLARASSVLLVDYSCAIRLATPLAIFTAMREAADRGVLIKGGKYMEAIAEANVVVFDKTGTLTKAKPVLVDVIPYGGRPREDVLRLAACLEEHFAHPVGQAVVRASDAEGLRHREEHTTVEYIVAHGIASMWRGQRVLIGSGHFVLEDEGITLTREQEEIVAGEAAQGRSILYLSIGGELAGLLMIEDAIREDTARVVQALHADGVARVIMLTGDSEATAHGIARHAGIAEYRSQMLPEDKAIFIRRLKEEGFRVAMVGDGINDSPALSEAHVGIAMGGGADMAREVADVVLVNEELQGLLLARILSRAALGRVKSSFMKSFFLNSVFLAGGLLGFIKPGLSAFLHNATTAVIAVASVNPMRPGLKPLDSAESKDRQSTEAI
jgi:Cu2+-exporting ATPase